MRGYEPIIPYKEMDRRDYELWRKVDDWNRQVASAMGNISRNTSPDQGQVPPIVPPGVQDHGALTGLVPTPDSITISDYNDDHTQYPLIFGRPDGQFIYGSRPTAGASWVPQGTFILAKGTASLGTWSVGTADANAVAGTGIILVLSSHRGVTSGSGETAYHTTITDTGGNTWTKLKEYTFNYSGAQDVTSSLWFCLVTSALTAGLGNLTATFSTSDPDACAAEGYAFTMTPGLSVVLTSYDTDGSSPVAPATATSMSLTGLTGETLFVRAMGVKPTSGATSIPFVPTSGFSAFASDHTDSTNTGLLPLNARGEFQILTGTGAASAPSFDPTADTYHCASIFGALQIVSSSGGVVIPTPVTGFLPLTGGFITAIRSTSESQWANIPIQTSATAGRLVFIVMATHSLDPGFGAGLTNYHTTITDSKSNTWTKLKEFTTSFFIGVEEQTVSLWYSILTADLVAGADTLIANYANTFVKKSIESYQFTLSSGCTVSLSASTTGGDDDADFEALALTAVTNPAIYIRGIAVHAAPADSPTTFTASAGYTAFTTDHTNSTNTSSEVTNRNIAARGEFLVSAASSSTSDPSTASANPDHASVFCAITLTSTSPPPNAYLRLGAANLADASVIELTGRDIRFNAGIGGGDFIFDPFGEGGYVGILNFDSITSSDKTYTFQDGNGTLAFLSDITALSAVYLKLDASNDPLTGTLDTQIIRPSVDNAYDIGDTTHFYKDLYISSDILLKTDGVTDFGSVAIGVKLTHYAYAPAAPNTPRVGHRGPIWEDNTLGDVVVGADNVFGSFGYYGQRSIKANSTATDNTEDATNLYQGNWGSGANPVYPFVDVNYHVGGGAVGKYTLGLDGVTYIRDGALTVGVYNGAVTRGGGGLFLGARIGSATTAGAGAYLHFDEANTRFIFRMLRGGSVMVPLAISQIMFAGNGLTSVIPETDNVVNLGVAATNRYKDLYLSGVLDHDGATLGFFNTTPAARASAYTVTNGTTDRAYDANATSIDELADVLATLIADLKTYGLLQ